MRSTRGRWTRTGRWEKSSGESRDASPLIFRLQGELEECKSSAAAVCDQLKGKEISFCEALAASSAATAAMQISLSESKKAEEALQQELKVRFCLSWIC